MSTNTENAARPVTTEVPGPRRGPPPPLKPRRFNLLSTTSSSAIRPAVRSTYLINNIPHGTTSVQLFNSIIAPPHWVGTEDSPVQFQPHVQFSCVISDSRLDDELSIAVLEFIDTPAWLRQANLDPYGFPKKTALGTLWRSVSMTDRDTQGHTEFMRAAIDDNLIYAETLAEFSDTDVNVQDVVGRTALHWACAKSLPAVVMLCLSVPGCNIGLRDNDDLTAFDIARQKDDEVIPSLFYRSILETDETDPQASLLQVLTISSEPTAENMLIFPGEAMFQPVEERNLALVTALITRGVDLATRNEVGNTALHVAAAMANNANIARELLTAGSDIDAAGCEGARPLHHAACTADKEMVMLLLQWKPDIAVKDNHQQTALHVAAQNGQQDVARLLLDHGADPTAKDDVGHTPLQLAEDSHKVDMVALLKNALGDGDQVGGEAHGGAIGNEGKALKEDFEEEETTQDASPATLLRAVEDNNLAAVLAFLAIGEDVEARYGDDKLTVLHIAAQAGHTEIVSALVGNGAKIQEEGEIHKTALHRAARCGHTETVSLLLDRGANIEAEDENRQTALHWAAWGGHTETVSLLLDRGANIEGEEYFRRTALHWTAWGGHTETATLLLDRGANVQAEDKSRRTALHCAARGGHTEEASLLLDRGANIEAEDVNRQTALHWAARSGHTKTAILLLDRGANIEALGEDRRTALHTAARNSESTMVTILLDRGANIEAVDRTSQTALHLAARSGDFTTVTALLDKGANIEAGSRFGTPVRIALRNGHTGVPTLLLGRGAKSTKGSRLVYALRHPLS